MPSYRPNPGKKMKMPTSLNCQLEKIFLFHSHGKTLANVFFLVFHSFADEFGHDGKIRSPRDQEQKNG
jgi:hypothetical protein